MSARGTAAELTRTHRASGSGYELQASRAGAVEAAARRLGISRLHPEQERVIADALEGRDVLMVVPTGFGKSACYQIPSMILPKPVLVISPLLALMRDQHEKLRRRDIHCVRIDGTVRGGARRDALDRVAAGGPLLVMTTPETLATSELTEALQRIGVGLVAVDEAHCISEWGHDFRPAYLRLGVRLQWFEAPILALTATATSKVREAIVHSLRMRSPSMVAVSPHRSNLAFEVLPCGMEERARALVRLVRRLRRPGIVYCATTREVDTVHLLLQRFGIPAERYHGRMTASERNAAQERYMRRGRRLVMVATSAFGLGIDKPDVRYVLHFQSPASLEQYVQEAGRAGRDGRRANCILLYDPSDRVIHEALLKRSRVRPEQLYSLGRALAAWADERRSPTLGALAVSAELGPRVTGALVAEIEAAGIVRWEDDRILFDGRSATLEEDVRGLAGRFETLRTQDGRRLDAVEHYTRERECRATLLRRYFGEPAGAPCGLCDNCRGRPARPADLFAPLAPLERPGRPGRPTRHTRRRRRPRTRPRPRQA